MVLTTSITDNLGMQDQTSRSVMSFRLLADSLGLKDVNSVNWLRWAVFVSGVLKSYEPDFSTNLHFLENFPIPS